MAPLRETRSARYADSGRHHTVHKLRRQPVAHRGRGHKLCGAETGLISDGAADGLELRRRPRTRFNLLGRHFRHAAIRVKPHDRAFGLVTVGDGCESRWRARRTPRETRPGEPLLRN